MISGLVSSFAIFPFPWRSSGPQLSYIIGNRRILDSRKPEIDAERSRGTMQGFIERPEHFRHLLLVLGFEEPFLKCFCRRAIRL